MIIIITIYIRRTNPIPLIDISAIRILKHTKVAHVCNKKRDPQRELIRMKSEGKHYKKAVDPRI